MDTRWRIEDDATDPEVAGTPRPLLTTWNVLLGALRRGWRVWVSLALAGGLAALALLLVRPPGGVATATILLVHPTASDTSAMATDVSLLEDPRRRHARDRRPRAGPEPGRLPLHGLGRAGDQPDPAGLRQGPDRRRGSAAGRRPRHGLPRLPRRPAPVPVGRAGARLPGPRGRAEGPARRRHPRVQRADRIRRRVADAGRRTCSASARRSAPRSTPPSGRSRTPPSRPTPPSRRPTWSTPLTRCRTHA